MDKSNENYDVSVVIPTFNRADMLELVLPSYLQFRSVKEVLVVDDGSTDGTQQTLACISDTDPRVRSLFHSKNQGRTAARNTGVANASGDLILISEDDLELASGSLDLLTAHMVASGADIIAGRRIWMRFGETHEEALRRANRYQGPAVNPRMLDVNSHAITTNDVYMPLVNATMLVRRHVFDKVRFANCYQGNAWREESDFQLSALENGFQIVFCPHALTFHHDRPNIGNSRGRLASDFRVLYWIFRNNLIFLHRHHHYLRKNLPESLWLDSPLLTSIVYLIHRAFWLVKAETRRGLAWIRPTEQWHEQVR